MHCNGARYQGGLSTFCNWTGERFTTLVCIQVNAQYHFDILTTMPLYSVFTTNTVFSWILLHCIVGLISRLVTPGQLQRTSTVHWMQLYNNKLLWCNIYESFSMGYQKSALLVAQAGCQIQSVLFTVCTSVHQCTPVCTRVHQYGPVPDIRSQWEPPAPAWSLSQPSQPWWPLLLPCLSFHVHLDFKRHWRPLHWVENTVHSGWWHKKLYTRCTYYVYTFLLIKNNCALWLVAGIRSCPTCPNRPTTLSVFLLFKPGHWQG